MLYLLIGVILIALSYFFFKPFWSRFNLKKILFILFPAYGKLPDGIKVSDLKKDHASILCNPDIARVCFIRGLIEMLGSGTQRMIKDCRQHSFEVPIWREGTREVVVEFPGLGVDEGVTIKDIDGVSEGVKGELEHILQYIKLQPDINAREIASLSDKSYLPYSGI